MFRYVQILDISGNTIGDTDMAEPLKYDNNALTLECLGTTNNSGNLELERCGITAEGAKSITDALKVNRTLEHLDISCNNIDDTGVVHMAEALQSNNALKRLELAASGLTEKGLTVLSASLVVNNYLQYLDIAIESHPWRLHTNKICRLQKLEAICIMLARESPSYKSQTWTSKRCSTRSDTVEDESSALNQVRRDKGLQELEIVWWEY